MFNFCFALCDSSTGDILQCYASKESVEVFNSMIESGDYPFVCYPHPENAFYTIIPPEYIQDMTCAREIRERLKVFPANVKGGEKDVDNNSIISCVVEIREKPLSLKINDYLQTLLNDSMLPK